MDVGSSFRDPCVNDLITKGYNRAVHGIQIHRFIPAAGGHIHVLHSRNHGIHHGIVHFFNDFKSLIDVCHSINKKLYFKPRPWTCA